MDEVAPLNQHNGFRVYPFAYSPKNDTLFLDIVPASDPVWAKVAYGIAQQDVMKYDVTPVPIELMASQGPKGFLFRPGLGMLCRGFPCRLSGGHEGLEPTTLTL